MSSTNLTPWVVKKKDMKLKGDEEVRVDLGIRGGVGIKMNRIHCM